MIVIGILGLLILSYIATVLAVTFDVFIRISANVTSIRTTQSKEHAKEVAEELWKLETEKRQ